jgi:hypothetical protein
MGGKRNTYKVLPQEPEGKRSFGRPRRSRMDNIKIDIKETVRCVLDSSGSPVNTVKEFSGSGRNLFS